MDANYEQKALELDKELALLLGYTNVEIVRQSLQVDLCGENKEGSLCTVPRWTQDDAAAFRLAVEYDVFPEMPIGLIFVRKDKISKVRYTIVQAVIIKLKGN